MFGVMPYLRPRPGTDGSRPVWLSALEGRTASPEGGQNKAVVVSFEVFETHDVNSDGTFGDGSFRMIVRRVRGGGPAVGESGMKEDQYPYRVLFSTAFTTASLQCRAP